MSQERRSLMGAYIRRQRKLADLSMRKVSTMVGISNPYLSQIERGLRAPSEAVAAGIATALGVSVEELYRTEPGVSADSEPFEAERTDLVEAIENATELTVAQRTALVEIYRSFARSNRSEQPSDEAAAHTGEDAEQSAEHD